MLTLRRATLAVMASLLTTMAVAPPAVADSVVCVPGPGGSKVCTTTATSPGGGAGTGSGDPASATQVRKKGSSKCTYYGEEIPCQSEFGEWSQDEQCWVQRVSPQPSQDDPRWEGHTDGAVWACSILGGGAVLGGGGIGGTRYFWAPAAGAGAPVLVDPVTLAEEAIDSMNLRAVMVGITPPPGPDSLTLVGIPTWMWVDEPGPSTWGPITRTASAGSVSVTATARVVRVVWEMGDGASVTCGKGTAYRPAFDDAPSPNCGHRYTAPGTYTVTATSFWEVEWAGAGQAGIIDFTLSRDATVRVAEAFALVDEQG